MQFQPGETREKNGVLYQRQADGTWIPQGTAAQSRLVPLAPPAPPSGYQTAPGGLRPIPGGPADPNAQPDKPNLPAGYRMGPSGVAERIPGLPPEATGGPKGFDAVDQEVGKEFAAYKLGGFADVYKQLDQLGTVHGDLGAKDNLTGPIVGNVPDLIGAAVNPAAINARETVEEVVQRSMKAILGAQFTEKEGERLIARTYNPRLPEEANRVRVGRLLKQLRDAAAAKEDAFRYFEKNGTLRGWQGKMPTIADFDPDSEVQQGGFTDEHKRQILEYLPQAKSAEDLMDFARRISRSEAGATTIGNADEVLKYVQGGGDPSQLKFEPADSVQMPTADFEILGYEDE